MTDINRVNLVGRLVKNAEYRQVGGKTKMTASIAVNKSRKTETGWEDEVSYIDIQAWGKTAEYTEGRLIQGTPVTVEGSLKQERWEKDGQTRSKLLVNVDIIVPHTYKEQANGF